MIEDKIIEVSQDDIRYILRRNPARAEELKLSRESKINLIKGIVDNGSVCFYSPLTDNKLHQTN